MLDAIDVKMKECRISDFSLNTPSEIDPDDAKDITLGMTSNFACNNLEGKRRKGRLKLSIKPTSGVYYSIEMTAVALFEFPDGTDEEESRDYMESYGAIRVFDFVKSSLESMTAFGVFGSIRIPLDYPLPPTE